MRLASGLCGKPMENRMNWKKQIGLPASLMAMVAFLALAAPTALFAQDTGRLAAAKELLLVTGAGKTMEAIIPLMARQLEAAFVKLKPEHSAEIRDIFKSATVKFSQRKGELIDKLAELYAEKFTEDELKTVADFYKTPVGRKFIEAQPEIGQKSFLIGQVWGQGIGKEIEGEVRRQLKQRNIEL